MSPVTMPPEKGQTMNTHLCPLSDQDCATAHGWDAYFSRPEQLAERRESAARKLKIAAQHPEWFRSREGHVLVKAWRSRCAS